MGETMSKVVMAAPPIVIDETSFKSLPVIVMGVFTLDDVEVGEMLKICGGERIVNGAAGLDVIVPPG